jgi:preprotein translocase subunit SecG
MLHSVLLIIHFICAFSIVGLVLLQRGKGAEAGAGFGAGASGTVFGARGASTALSRATAILAGLFMLTSLSLTYVGSHKTAPSGSGTILEQLSQQPATAPAQPPTPLGPAAGSTAPSAAPSAPVSAPSSNAPTPSAPPPASGTAPANK